MGPLTASQLRTRALCEFLQGSVLILETQLRISKVVIFIPWAALPQQGLKPQVLDIEQSSTSTTSDPEDFAVQGVGGCACG